MTLIFGIKIMMQKGKLFNSCKDSLGKNRTVVERNIYVTSGFCCIIIK